MNNQKMEEKLAKIENTGAWKDLQCPLFEEKILSNSVFTLRVIFLLTDLLVDGIYSSRDQREILSLLKNISSKAFRKYSEDIEFSFYMGMITSIAEWYFDYDSIENAYGLIEKAMNASPTKTLYLWGYYLKVDQRIEKNSAIKFYLSNELIEQNIAKSSDLKQKGLLGVYIIGLIEDCYLEQLKFFRENGVNI